MSARVHPREMGVTLRCNYQDCPARYTTAAIRIKANRKAASKDGWIRGLRKRGTSKLTANTKWDVCPVHATDEKNAAMTRKLAADERRAKRDAGRKARAVVK